MKKATNSKKNKYKIHLHPLSYKSKRDPHGQDCDPIFSFKRGAYPQSKYVDSVRTIKDSSTRYVEESGNITKKGDLVSGFPSHERKRSEGEMRVSTTGQEPFLPRKETASLHKLNGPFSHGEKKVPSQLLRLGGFSSHFGRKLRDIDFPFPWHASMCSKFSGIRNKVPHINGEQTLQSLVEAFYCIALVLRKGGKVLVVNKNSEFSSLFHTNSLDAKLYLPNKDLNNTDSSLSSTFCEAKSHSTLLEETVWSQSKETISTKSKDFRTRYVEYRSKCRPATAPFKWVGGCLTNWKEISKSVATLLYFSKRFGRFIKQNNIHFPRFKKMKTSFQGFINAEKEELLLKAPPQLLFLFNAHESEQILQEAITLQIPVVALTDSSTDLSQITYPIPINSDSAPLIHRCLSQLMQMTDRQGGFSR